MTTFNELCDRLKNNIEEKNVFFQNLKSEKFLIPLYKQGMLNFDDSAGSAIIGYLLKILKKTADYKQEVIDAINSNLNKSDLKISYYNYTALLELIEQFSAEEVNNNINYKTLLESNYASRFCRTLLKKDISKQINLCKDCIQSLIRYKYSDENPRKENIVELKYNEEIYDIKKIIYEYPYKENLCKIMQNKSIYDCLIEEYKNIYNIIGQKDFSLIDRQAINRDLKSRDSYSVSDVRNIILDLLSIYLDKNNSQEVVNNLLDSNILMLNKLGLYAIARNFGENKNKFIEYFNKINKEQLYYTCYELMSILEIIDEATSEKIYNKFEQLDEHERYRLLHSLKENINLKTRANGTGFLQKYKIEFEHMKNKYKSEIPNPKILFKLELTTLRPISPIQKIEFEKYTIAEQIEYINNYDFSNEDIKFDKNTCVSENELNKIFKQLLEANIEDYLNSNEIQKLNKDIFMASVFETIETKINSNKISDFDKVLNILISYNPKENNEIFHYQRYRLLAIMAEKYKKNSNIKLIADLVQKYINESKDVNQSFFEELIYVNASSSIGKYLDLFILMLAQNNELYGRYSNFLNDFYDNSSTINKMLFCYNWGKYYSWLQTIDEFKIEKFDDKQLKEAFIEGFLNNTNHINIFSELKEDILSFYKDENFSKTAKNNFMFTLIHIKFVLKDDELFKFFENTFTPDEKKDFLWKTLYPERNPKYDNNLIYEYCKKEIDNNFEFPEIILTVFNEYLSVQDFYNHIETLKKLFQLCKYQENSSHLELELSDFLKILYNYLNAEVEKESLVSIFNLLKEIIPIFDKCDFITLSEANQLFSIIKRYYDLSNNSENCKILINDIIQTTKLIQHSNIFIEFLKSIS